MPHVLPVVGRPLEGLGLQAGVALLEAQGLDHGLEAGLAGQPGQGGHGAIDDVHALLGGEQVRGHLPAGAVVGVEVDRQAHFLTEGPHQGTGGERLAQAGHVLDGD